MDNRGAPRKSYQTGGFGGSNGYGGQSNGYGNGGGYGNSGYEGNAGAAPFNSNAGNAATPEHPLAAAIKENIKQMSTNVTLITKFVTVLGTTKDTPDMRHKLNGTIESTKQLAKDTSHQLKELSMAAGGNLKVVHQKLAKDFSVWLEKFQEISKVSAQKERTLLPPKSSQAPSNSKPGQQDAFPSNGGYDEPVDEKQSLLEANRKQQLIQIDNEREFNDALISDREAGIKQIEVTIREVNEIFTDLAHLVNEQGYMIDNIESNIESTAHNTAEGVVELKKASEHQKSARSKMCWLLLIIAIVAAVITVILVLSIKL